MSEEYVTEPLSQKAYVLPDSVQTTDQDLAMLHASLVSRLRREMSEGRPPSALTEMLIERVATTYVMTKHGELSGRLADPRVYKEVNAMFLSMAGALQRATETSRETDKVRTLYENALMAAVDRASAMMPPDQARAMRASLADEVERIGM